MNIKLLSDMYYAAPEMWFVIIGMFLCLVISWVGTYFALIKQKKKAYFINRDRERLFGSLFAAKDGYFCFIYPDERFDDLKKHLREKCSRRLSVILNLPNGMNSSFDDVLKCFYKNDAQKIAKYTELLVSDGIAFEEEFDLKNTPQKKILIYGSRINSSKGHLFCDIVWFRDVSQTTNLIDSLKKQVEETNQKHQKLQDLIDNLPYPIWLCDNMQNISAANKKYAEMTSAKDTFDAVERNVDLVNSAGKSVIKMPHPNKISGQKQTTFTTNLTHLGKSTAFEIWEKSFAFDQNMDNVWVAGMAINIEKQDDLQRKIKLAQKSHLEILSALETPFAVFDAKQQLSFYNDAFMKLWSLEKVWLEQQPSYGSFLDVIRDKRRLPEPSNYLLFKEEECAAFFKIIEPQKDLLHLPSGQTIQRLRMPYSSGGLAFAFEDISDRIARESSYNSLLNIHQETLDNVFDAIVIFAPNGFVSFYNEPFLKLWKQEDGFALKEMSLTELLDLHKPFFDNQTNWVSIKKQIYDHILNPTTKSFKLKTTVGTIYVMSKTLGDGSLMITYKKENESIPSN